MDTSETYIEMCKKAEEIQSRKPGGSQGEFVYCEGEVYQEMDDRPLTPFIWLPRQDQLQEMVASAEIEPALIIQDKLAHFSMWVRYQCHEPFTSMEQLWLAFVMKEKQGKVWDGEKWTTAVLAKIGS